MDDLKTGDPLFPPNFVTIHDLREQWLRRRQPPQQQQRQKQLETRPRSPPGKPPQRRPPPPPPLLPVPPPPAQEDRRKQPEQERPRREADVEREREKGGPRNECDSRPSPANRWAVRCNASVKEGSGGREAIESSVPKPSEKSSRGVCAGFGADEKAESALVKDPRKPEQERPLGEPDTEREKVKASPTNASNSRPSPANRWAVRRNADVEEGSGGRQAIDSSGRKPSEKSSRGEFAGFGADKKAESTSVKDQRKQPEQELPRGETNTARERGKANPRNECDSRPSPANRWAVRHHTSVKEGTGGREVIDSNGLKPSEKSSRGEYAGIGAEEKAESALVAVVSAVAESAEQVKKTEESEKNKRKKKCKNSKRKGKAMLNKDIVRAKEMGAKPEEGEVNEPAEEVKMERFQRASSEGQNVMQETKDVRVEVKPEEGVVHSPAKEAKKLFQRAGSESKNAMPESKEVQVEVENVAANASHVGPKAEGLNKQVWAIHSKVEIEGKLRNLSLQYDSKKGGFQSRWSNRGDHKGYRGNEGKEQQRRVIKQSSDMVWMKKENISDGPAGESSS